MRSVVDNELGPEHLVVEITEATAIGNFKLTSAVLEQLRAHGLRVVLDDFGTGYSSLACLDQLPISGLKLDPSFTRREAERPQIFSAVVALARSLGLTVTAEGVEEIEQFERLRAVGCKYAQGYLISRPLDADSITVALASGRRWMPEDVHATA
jgi:EAL domain-containing protein (putative c-di-GMP-specific phosphodiesterase class I)